MSNVTLTTDGTRPGGVVPVLPAPAAAKLDHLDGLADAAAAQNDAKADTYRRLAADAYAAKGDVASYEGRCRDEGKDPHAGSLAEMQARHERAARALKLHTEAAPFLDGNAVGRLRKDCLIEARRHGADAKLWCTAIRKGGSIPMLREVLADLRTERSSVEAAPPPLQTERDRLFGEIDAAAARGKPRAGIVIDDAYDPRGPARRMKLRAASQINWPTVPIDAARQSASFEPLVIIDAASMISWLFGDLIKKAIGEELEAAYASFDGRTMSLEERRAELKRVATDIHTAEQELAALAWPDILGGDHQAVRHLFDLSPKAVLGLEG